MHQNCIKFVDAIIMHQTLSWASYKLMLKASSYLWATEKSPDHCVNYRTLFMVLSLQYSQKCISLKTLFFPGSGSQSANPHVFTKLKFIVWKNLIILWHLIHVMLVAFHKCQCKGYLSLYSSSMRTIVDNFAVYSVWRYQEVYDL